jgi:hypothetical protein
LTPTKPNGISKQQMKFVGDTKESSYAGSQLMECAGAAID